MFRCCMAFLLLTSTVLAQEPEPGEARREDYTFYKGNERVPARVRAQASCERGQDEFGSRLAFGSGYVFELPCPGDTKNLNRAMVFAGSPDGTGAKAMHFPVPRGVKRADFSILANPRYFPAAREIREAPVGRGGKDCRVDARWRLDMHGKASLIYWRETSDCEGQTGWRTRVDRRAQAR
jgi:hypothetical protein